MLRRAVSAVVLLLSTLAVTSLLSVSAASAADLPVPDIGTGGPILVLTSGTSPFESYYAEILRNEGFNAFAVRSLGSVDSQTIAAYEVIILTEVAPSAGQVTLLSNWVNAGGKLIAMRPSAALDGLLGISTVGTTLANTYLRFETSGGAGYGIASETMQFHGTASRYSLNGATSLATLYSSAITATANPAVTLRSVGANGGQVVAFAFDLARSIVYTRQGNPAWAGQERDGSLPRRSNDMFYGNSATDPQPDWVDLDKAAIPQADEQQRFLANLILHLTRDRLPLPRFWYFPRGERAVVIMTGDDHANGGTIPRFNSFLQESEPGCAVEDWECIRGTSYVYPHTPITPQQATTFEAQGFEVGLHLDTGCSNFTASSLDGNYAQQLSQFAAAFPGVPAPTTQRHHCIVWSDWSTGAEVQLANGIRLDTSYYYFPGSWVANRPGYFTGSAMPMRFSALDGDLIDVYQAATQLTDESGQVYPYTIDTLLDWALGPEERYGALVINAHTDVHPIPESTTTVASAKARGVPVVSARQMLEWLDGRNSSAFANMSWNGTALSFGVAADVDANGLQALVPWVSEAGVVVGVQRNGSPVAFDFDAVKGVGYARFDTSTGNYSVVYGPDTIAPTLAPIDPVDGATFVNPGAPISAGFSEGMSGDSFASAQFDLLAGGIIPVAATTSYSPTDQTVTLTPLAPLQTGSFYTVIARGGASGPTDLAGNPLTADVAWSFTTMPAPACPCRVFSDTDTPLFPSDPDTSPIEIGMRFRADLPGFVTGVRFYKGAGNVGTHVGNLWSTNGTRLAAATFTNETASGWQQVEFANPVAIAADTEYVVSYHAPNGRYSADTNAFATTGVDNYPLHAPASGTSTVNGVYRYGSTSQYPFDTYQATNYWVDVVFETDVAPDVTPPSVSSTTPTSGATDVGLAEPITATFSESMNAGTISPSSFELRDSGGALVPAALSYDGFARTARLTPNAALAPLSTYSALVRGGATGPRDLAGLPLPADVSWTFTTGPQSVCPCTGFDATDVPGTPAENDSNAVEVGVKFRSDQDGFISAVRFYKGSGNTGTHIGNLWSSDGTLLASAIFTNETATGWQQVDFASPVPISAGAIYIASYHAPNGHYAADGGFFSEFGVDNPPIRLLRNGVSGGNGVYSYSTSSAFPNSTYNATNYWVDVVFASGNGAPPSVVAIQPPDASPAVSAQATVRATFSEPMSATTLNAATFSLRDAGAVLVPASVVYDAASLTVILDPVADLAFGATYSVSLLGGPSGALDSGGEPLAGDVTWSFTTNNAPDCCSVWTAADVPPNPSENDSSPVELGVKFTSEVDGSVTGIRFYKGTGNTGTHVGSLWTSGGTLLASAVFTGETSTGWQEVAFPSPVPITAGAVYVASYHAPNGRYAASSDYFSAGGVDRPPLHLLQNGVSGGNGVYAYGPSGQFPNNTYQATNYWVDVVLATGGVQPLQVVSTVPANGAGNANPAGAVSARFNQSINPATLTPANFELRTSGGVLVPGTLSYVDATRTASLAAALSVSSTYTATVRGGPSGVLDLAGAPLASDVVWTFTTAAASACCSVWSDLDVPAEPSANDSNSVELGVKFRSAQNGFISGIRFYKGTGNTGTHVGNLWTANGVLLASATFTGESATGWQQVFFAEPIAIAANVVYVASYFAPNGGYAGDAGFFAASGVSNPPLYLLQDGESGGNGVYAYAASSAFPNSTWNASNYWVDPVFTTSNGAAPTVSGTVPLDQSTGAPTGVPIQATFSEAMNPATISSANFELRTAGGSLVPATVQYDAATLSARLIPVADLAFDSIYTARILGGASGPLDVDGLPLAADVQWSFTTMSESTCCSAWTPNDAPANPSEADTSAVELGVKFRVDQPGFVSSIRFYKGIGNTGTHVGNLWTSTGTLLASATFTNETATGWQQVTFPTPVAVAPGVTYVASYHAPNGGYAADPGYFAAAGVDSGPLHLLQDGVDGGNGVYAYSPTSAFPDGTFNAGNYWVDVVFSTQNLAPECITPANEIIAENCRIGSPPSQWDITGIGDPSIQGFATEISVNRGQAVSFKIDTNADDYRLDIYRLGYYGGSGARFVATVTPSATLPQDQPSCDVELSTGLIDCGNWAVSASWNVPADATSGIYVAKATRTDTNGASHIVFIVRDDASDSKMVFQTSDTTWQAYNEYGGNSLYVGAPAGRAYKVSYNRPFTTRVVDDGQDWLFNSEYPMIRWLESNGYDVSYITGVDVQRAPALLLNHDVFLSVGHDEYWSAEQRTGVTAARDAGVHLAFFSGNEVFWKTRFEDGERTIACYKETHAGTPIDPEGPSVWTGTWRDPRFSPPGDGGFPENELTGQIFTVNNGATTSIRVPSADGRMRFWRNTSIASMTPGSTATLASETLGYEWDEDLDNGFRPAGSVRMSTTTVANAPVLQDYGSTYASGTATHHLTLYKAGSGALVFGAGTVQWMWGLDPVHDRGGDDVADVRMQQATVNLFADMGVQPLALRPGLQPATGSTDFTPPTATVTLPTNGATLNVGNPVTISGSAADFGGGVVGGVEISVNGGATWRPANGREAWSYTWTPSATGAATIRARAADDSANLGAPGAAINVNVQ